MLFLSPGGGNFLKGKIDGKKENRRYLGGKFKRRSRGYERESGFLRPFPLVQTGPSSHFSFSFPFGNMH
jgi:hypothetical protein